MDILRPDSEFMEFLSKVADFMILNVLCFLLSMPIITAGAAFTAKYYVAMKIVRGEEPSVWKSYWKSFRENFFQITPVWMVFAIIFAVLGLDWYNILFGASQNIVWVAKIFLGVFTFFAWSTVYCLFPFVAYFHSSTREAIKGAMLMSFLLLPKMVLVFIAIFLPYLICAWYIEWGLAIWIFATTVTLYYVSRMMNRQLSLIQNGGNA